MLCVDGSQSLTAVKSLSTAHRTNPKDFAGNWAAAQCTAQVQQNFAGWWAKAQRTAHYNGMIRKIANDKENSIQKFRKRSITNKSQRFHAHFRVGPIGRRGRQMPAEKPRIFRVGAANLLLGQQMATVFSVRASAGKGSFSASLVSVDPLVIKAGIAAQPMKGQANRELLSELENLLGCKVGLVAGANGRKKTLAADCTAENIVQKIKQQKR